MNSINLLRVNYDYRNLLLASIGSQFGNWFNEVALAQVTLTITHSSIAMGFVLLCRSLPSVLLSPFVGPLVDKFPKRTILLWTDSIRAVFALSLSLSVLIHMSFVLYIVSFLMGIAGILFNPARNAVVPLIVTGEELVIANALESQTSGLIQIVGATLGGIVSVTVGPIACFAVNATSYLWSAWHIRKCHWSEVSSTVGAEAYTQSLKTGFHEVLCNNVVRTIVIIGISWGLAGGGYYILIPVLGQQVYNMGGLGIGLLYVVDGMGVLIGAFFVNQFVGENRFRAVFFYGLAYVTQALFFALLTQFTVFFFGAIMLLLMRISSGIIIPLDTYILQISTPVAVRGRVFALHGSTYGGFMQLSYAFMGLFLSRFGVPIVGLAIGIMSLICGVTWLAQFKVLYGRIRENEYQTAEV